MKGNTFWSSVEVQFPTCSSKDMSWDANVAVAGAVRVGEVDVEGAFVEVVAVVDEGALATAVAVAGGAAAANEGAVVATEVAVAGGVVRLEGNASVGGEAEESV